MEEQVCSVLSEVVKEVLKIDIGALPDVSRVKL